MGATNARTLTNHEFEMVPKGSSGSRQMSQRRNELDTFWAMRDDDDGGELDMAKTIREADADDVTLY